jgi:hypothetical protein
LSYLNVCRRGADDRQSTGEARAVTAKVLDFEPPEDAKDPENLAEVGGRLRSIDRTLHFIQKALEDLVQAKVAERAHLDDRLGAIAAEVRATYDLAAEERRLRLLREAEATNAEYLESIAIPPEEPTGRSSIPAEAAREEGDA